MMTLQVSLMGSTPTIQTTLSQYTNNPDHTVTVPEHFTCNSLLPTTCFGHSFDHQIEKM